MKLSVLLYTVRYKVTQLLTRCFYIFLFKKIGKKSVLFKPLILFNSEQVEIGDRVLIREGLRLQVLDRPDSRKALIVIGDDVNIEQNCHIICQNRILIGKKVSITGGCAIVDTTHSYHVQEGKKVGDEINFNDDEVIIGDNVFIGFGSIILPGTYIGSNSYVGAMSVVKGKYPERSLIYGMPAKLVKKI